MDDHVEAGNAFAIPDLWKTSTLPHFDQDATDLIALGLEPLDLQGDHDCVFGITKNLELHLPNLSTFDYGPVEDLGTLEASSISSSIESLEVAEAFEEDIWSFPRSEKKEQRSSQFRSWETFYDKSFQEPRTVYISEGGAGVFDAALYAVAESSITEGSCPSPGRVIQAGPLLASLHQLGLGRESVLFYYSEESRSFCPRVEDGRMSGYSLEAFKSLSATFIDHGNKTKKLQAFVDKTQVSSESSPSLIALARIFADMLIRIQIQAGNPPRPIHSLLQLHSLFERPNSVLSCLLDVLNTVSGATTDADLLSRLYEMVQDSEHTTAWLRPMMLQMLASASKPWLESVSGWLGLEMDLNSKTDRQGQLPGFVGIMEEVCKIQGGKEIKELDYELEPHSMPTFIAKDDARVVFETGRSLRLLEAHQPDHPLLEPVSVNAVATPTLEWHFSWNDVEKIQAQAQAYESNLRNTIKDFDSRNRNAGLRHRQFESPKPKNIEPKGLSEETAVAYINASISAIEEALPELSATNGDLLMGTFSSGLVHSKNALAEELFAPPISLLPILSFNSLISTQAHLTNRACLRLLFKEHNLPSHFSILHRYNLFADGVFTSRLSHALFDPEFQTAERRKGHSRAGTSGLKLGSRETWPPASSELRLALMGILTDSYFHTREREGSSIFRSELPGGLSFSIREMSEAELQRCMDPDSIEALDFLKLEYRPPPPLDAVITQASLIKYDVVFRLLLRAVRMLFVVNQLFRGTRSRPRSVDQRREDLLSQSFRIESHHFVVAICGYFFDGVQTNWSNIDRKLKDIDKALDRDGTDDLSDLRDFHEKVLDRMMFALILRKRQAQVMKLLEEIFSLILRFAGHLGSSSAAFEEIEGPESKADVEEVYVRFKKKVRVFINVCRGLSERRGQGGSIAHLDLSRNEEMSEDGGNTVGQLLLKLEMSGYYAP